MNELIPINYNDDGTQAVSGRALHEFLEIETRYNDWFKRMTEYGLIEGHDYVTVSQKRPIAKTAGREVLLKNEYNPQGGRPSIDHALTIDCAKEISMLQRTPKGRRARKYFIECEKRLKVLELPSYQIEDEVLRARKWITELKRTKELEAQVIEYKPKAQIYDAYEAIGGAVSVKELAGKLTDNGFPIGQNTLFQRLKQDSFIYQEKDGTWKAYQAYITQGLFSYRYGQRPSNSTGWKRTMTLRVTPKGVNYFLKKYCLNDQLALQN